MSNQQIEITNNRQVIEMAKNDFVAVAVDKKIAWEKEFNFALQVLGSNEYLNKVAWGNQQSLGNAIVNISAIGISLNPALKHAYLVPRKGKICLDISYMGLLHLACMSGSITWGQSKIVYENDNYMSRGIDKAPIHEYKAFGDRGAIVGVYCTVKTSTGDYLTEEMDINEVYSIRGRSEAFKKKSGPWVTDEGQMIRKTCLKRGSSYWPKVERLDTAINMLNVENGEGIDFEAEKEKPAGKSGNWRAGTNPLILPKKLQDVFEIIHEHYEIGDFQEVANHFATFALIEEKNAVWKCFASDERTAINKYSKNEGYVQVVNIEQIEYLEGDELEQFLEKFGL